MANMERFTNCELIIDILEIEAIDGGNQSFEIRYIAQDEKRYKLTFECVWGLRYSIEEGYIDQGHHIWKNTSKDVVVNGIYIIEDSEYLKYFERQVSGTRPVDGITVYFIGDKTDTCVEVLALSKPILEKL